MHGTPIMLSELSKLELGNQQPATDNQWQLMTMSQLTKTQKQL